MRYFEDIEPGGVERFGSYEVTREEVLDFARKYDPQPFHLSDEAAAATHFGRLSASGWHTCAMFMAMMSRHFMATGYAGLGSPGQEELRWHRPVHPGDRLTAQREVLEKRRSKSRPEMGVVRSRGRMFNQHGELVLSVISVDMVAVRPD